MEKEFIDRIKQIQSELGYTSDGKFADDIGVTRSNFSQMMQGKRPIGEGILNKMQLHLNISKEWIVKGEGNMLITNQTTIPDITSRIKMIIQAFCDNNYRL